jgi:hypothetical protein
MLKEPSMNLKKEKQADLRIKLEIRAPLIYGSFVARGRPPLVTRIIPTSGLGASTSVSGDFTYYFMSPI